MNDIDFLVTAAIVFLSVVLPYLLVTVYMRTPKTDPEELGKRNLPPYFRRLWPVLVLFTEPVGRPLARLQEGRAKKLAEQIAIAGARMEPEHVFAAEIASLAGGAALFTVFALLISGDAGKLALGFLLGGFLGWTLPSISLGNAAQTRQAEIMKALPFAIDLIGSAMRSGIDFTAAVRYYCMNGDRTAPLVQEFATMLGELEYGRTRSEALDAMAGRIRHEAFSAFADAAIHGLEIGASIVATMKVQAEELRRIRFNAAEQKAARAVSSMIFPIAIFIMPAMFIIIGTPIILRVMASGLGGILK